MKFFVICALMWVSVQGQYNYDQPEEAIAGYNYDLVQRNDNTVAENFDQILNSYGSTDDIQQGKARPQRNNCKAKCCKFR